MCGTSCLVGSNAWHVVVPTLAVVLTWILVGIVLAGIGSVVRGLLVRAPAPPRRRELAAADLWIGLAALLAYLELWNLALPVDGEAWILPLVVAAAGLLTARPSLPRASGRRLACVAVLGGLATLWVANTALGKPGDSDDGLYHLGTIEYAQRYRTIPGLGNLATRLAAGDAHLLLVALLNQGPWARAGWHLADGLLATMLVVELGLRLLRPAPPETSFTRRATLLLAVATFVCIGIRPTHRITSPNLDFAAFVLVVIGMLYLADCVENRFRPPEALAAVAALASAAATRPLFWIMTLLALGVLALELRAAGGRAWRRLGAFAAVCALPGALALGWMARQTILSGYPFYPLTLGGLPVSWRMPVSAVTAANNVDLAWARNPNAAASVVLKSWQWVNAYWFPYVRDDADVVLPLLLLACLVPSLVGGRTGDPGRRARRPAMLAVVLPSLVTLVAWFLTAPDPRFAFAPIWLVPIALAAWALPPLRRPTPAMVALALATGAALAGTLGVGGLGAFLWLLPVELALWCYLAAFSRLLRLSRSGALLAHAAALSAVVAAVGVVAAREHPFTLVVANKSGPLGTPLEPTPTVRGVRTSSGLRVWEPAAGDACFEILLCTPPVPGISSALHLRGDGVGSGFSVG